MILVNDMKSIMLSMVCFIRSGTFTEAEFPMKAFVRLSLLREKKSGRSVVEFLPDY